MFEVIFLYILFASVFTLGKAAIAYGQPIFFTSIRMILGGLILMAGYYWYNPKSFKQHLSRRYLPLWIVLALFNIYFTNVLEFWALQFLPAAKACFIYNLSPFFAALISYFVFAERMTLKKWLGLGIGFVGVIPLLLTESPGEHKLGGISFLSWAELAILGAAIATVYGWISMRRLVKFEHISPIMANGISMFWGGLLALPTSYFVETWNPLPISQPGPFFIYLIVIMVISNILSYNIYGFLLKKYTATFMSFCGFMSPLFAAIFAWLWLGEEVSWPFYISAILVFAGLYIFYQEELRQGYMVRKC